MERVWLGSFAKALRVGIQHANHIFAPPGGCGGVVVAVVAMGETPVDWQLRGVKCCLVVVEIDWLIGGCVLWLWQWL